MVVMLVASATACCSALALFGISRPADRDRASLGCIEACCAQLNELLQKAAVALAIVIAVLSTGTGSKWGAQFAAHPEWFGPAADAAIDFTGTDFAADECQGSVDPCRALPGEPASHGAAGSPNGPESPF